MMTVYRSSFVVALLLVGFPPVAWAQGVASSFEQLPLLVGQGDAVSVRDSSGAETTGKIDSVSVSSLTLVTSGRARLGTVIGLGAGIAGGALFFGLTNCHYGSDSAAAMVACGAVSGGIIVGSMFVGRVIGSRIANRRVFQETDVTSVQRRGHTKEVIYERPGRSAAFGVAPLLGNRRQGVALLVTF